MPLKPLERERWKSAEKARDNEAVLRSESLFRHGTTWLTAILCLEVLLVAIFQTPSLSFDRFAFIGTREASWQFRT